VDGEEAGTLFPVGQYETGTPRTPRERRESGPVVPRQPGWTLLGNRHGPVGYHLIEAQGLHGLMFARCGEFGRYIPDSQRGIIMCPECLAKEA
jgi:hypothetical protein